MRFQSIYVDMRPMLVKWLGFAFALVFLFLLLASIRPDFQHTVEHYVQLYNQQFEAGKKQGMVNFWIACFKSEPCWKGLLFSWKASLMTKSLLLAGLVFGIAGASYGMYWRPEVMAMRDVRVNSTRVEESRESSPVPPRGQL